MHQLQFFRASGRLPRRFFWIGVLLLLILLSCAVFVSVLLAGVARSATGSETVSFAVFAVLGGLSILAGLYSLTCLMSQRLHDFGRPGIWALGFYALLAVGIAGIRIGGIAGASSSSAPGQATRHTISMVIRYQHRFRLTRSSDPLAPRHTEIEIIKNLYIYRGEYSVDENHLKDDAK